jgi:hypothetical protein
MSDQHNLPPLARNTIGNRHYLDAESMSQVRALVHVHGLRPMVDAVATAARELHEAGTPIKDAYGDPMDGNDILTAYHGLTEGDLY